MFKRLIATLVTLIWFKRSGYESELYSRVYSVPVTKRSAAA